MLPALLYLPWVSGCTVPPDATIRFGIPVAPLTLDPRRSSSAASERIGQLLYRALVRFNAQYQPVPDLADWEQMDRRHYRFTLGDAGRRFHDGSRLVAADVKATYDWILDPDNGSVKRGALDSIERVETAGKDVVDFFLRRPDALFPAHLTVGIVPAALIAAGHVLDDQPMGSGPFRFLARQADDTLSLLRVKDGQRVDFVVVKEPVVRVLKLVRGELDLIQGEVPYEMRAWLERHPQVRVQSRPGNVYTYVGFHLQHPLLRNLLVRQAISYALDRDAIIRYMMHGEAEKADSMMPSGHWLKHPALPEYEYDPPRARRLLQQAGYYDGPRPALEYKTSGNPFRIRLATVIQHQLAEVGLQVRLRPLEWGTFFGDVREGRFQLYSLSWVGIKLPDIYRRVFHSESVPPAGANRGRYADATVDRLIDEAEQARNETSRRSAYLQLQEHLHQQLPYVPLWHEHYVLALRSEIIGYQLDAEGSYRGLSEIYREAQ